jgi:hypothetical protein
VPKTSKIEGIKETVRLLKDIKPTEPEYVHGAIIVSKKLIAQLCVLELLPIMTLDEIAVECGVDEKSVRFWRDCDQCPKLNNFVKLIALYERVRENCGKTSGKSKDASTVNKRLTAS